MPDRIIQKWPLAVLAVLSCSLVTPARATVLTYTELNPPPSFGLGAVGSIFPGSSFAGQKIIEIRLYWDVVVPEGYDAADVEADLRLPVWTNNARLVDYDLDGDTLGWSGAGTFNYVEVSDRSDLAFGPDFTQYWWAAGGLPLGIGDILASTRVEIDYVVLMPGDTDGDGDVDDSDLGTIFANYTGPVGVEGWKIPARGDADDDGDVDDSDLGTAFAAYTGPMSPATVPEPASLALVTLGGWWVARRRPSV